MKVPDVTLHSVQRTGLRGSVISEPCYLICHLNVPTTFRYKLSFPLFPFFSCDDPKKVSLAEATVNSVEKLTTDLQDTARVVSEMAAREHRTLEQSLAYMGVVERMNLLQREWATKVSIWGR